MKLNIGEVKLVEETEKVILCADITYGVDSFTLEYEYDISLKKIILYMRDQMLF